MKLIASAIAGFMVAGAAQAAIVSVSDVTASTGASASIIAAPSQALDGSQTNTAQQGFNEAQGVFLTDEIQVDGGTIDAGQRVDSHMIFLNSANSYIGHFGVEWVFDGTILGVMSDRGGQLESATTSLLGSATTDYGDPVDPDAAPFAARGLEANNGSNCSPRNDGYTFSGNTLCLSMEVSQPGDWVRVVTLSAIPLPAALPLFLAGLGGLGLMARRKRA